MSSLPFQDAYDSDDAGGDDELSAADKDVKDASMKWTGTAWWHKFAEVGVDTCSMYLTSLSQVEGQCLVAETTQMHWSMCKTCVMMLQRFLWQL